MFCAGGSVKGQKMSFLFRLGVTLIALLALHVVFTIYRQLGEVSQVFREIAQSGVVTYYKGNTPIAKKEHTRRHSPSHNTFNSKNNNNNNVKEPELMSQRTGLSKSHRGENVGFRTTKAKYIKELRSNFQEKVYTIESRISESHPKPSVGPHFHEKEGNIQSKNAPFSDYPNNVPFPCISRGNVMILAYRRSGSSFLGEMFNRNPKIFYLFEPIQPIEVIAGHGKFPLLYDTLVQHLLDVIYTCSFSKHPFLVSFLSSSAFRLKSEILTSSNLCEAAATAQKMHLCRPLNATFLTKLCSSSAHTVVKTIRANNQKILEFIAESGVEDKARSALFKVIHLVRDPRAIISSRLTMYQRNISQNWSENNMRNEVNGTRRLHTLTRFVRIASSNLCSRIFSDIKHGRENLLYARIRYEDAAMRPLRAYEEIYEFAGISESLQVRKWLEINTKSDWDPGFYSTSRNSTASVHGWRSRLPFSLVVEIQQQCGQLMTILGYLPVQDEKQLKDMSKTLLIPLTEGILLRTNPMNGDKVGQSRTSQGIFV